MAGIVIKDMKKEYPNGFVAIEGMNLDIPDKEFVVLVGPSGCAKSTTLKMIAGLEEISAGEMYIGDRLVNDVAPKDREIAMVFQDPMTSLNPLYTIQDQMEEVMKLHEDMTAELRKNRCIELLEEVGISRPETRLKNYPHQFSGGMRQRVIIAIALASRPKLLIADEPTTALDVTIQSQILNLMKRLVKEHRTALMLITHDLAVVSEMTDKIMVMYCGRIVEKGTRDAIIKRCRHPYTFGLLGSIPKLGSRQRRLLQIRGMVPNIMDLPTGCAFAPRCDYAREQCRRHRPELIEIEKGHAAACFFPVER